MLSSLVLVAALAPTHLVGDGGLIGQAQPVLAVRSGKKERAAVHGWFSWEYGEGLDELLADEQRLELDELRKRHVALTSAAAGCAVVGSAVTALGLYLTPNFVNVDQPEPGGLVVPILIGVFGAAVGLAAIPLSYFAPGDNEIETLVDSHNSAAEADARLELSREVIPGATLTLTPDQPGAKRPERSRRSSRAERSDLVDSVDRVDRIDSEDDADDAADDSDEFDLSDLDEPYEP